MQPGLAGGVYKVLGVRNALAAFRSAGSTAPAEVAGQLAYWRTRLTTDGSGGRPGRHIRYNRRETARFRPGVAKTRCAPSASVC